MARTLPLRPDSVVRAVDLQVSSRLSDEVAILELDQGVHFGLNNTGAFLWNLMQQPVRVNEMRAALVEEFEVDVETVEKDLLRVLGELRDAGLIEHVDLN
jgi:hypothetical protein